MPLYEASVQHAFTADHALPLPTGGMEDSHKHTWLMTATFRARQLDSTMAVVIDFTLVLDALSAIAATFEGGSLNDHADFIDGRPSAERVAQVVAESLTEQLDALLTDPSEKGPWLQRVEVTEAPGCAAAYLPADSK